MKKLIIPVFLCSLLAACGPQTHFVVHNNDVTFSQAEHDLNSCRLDAAKSAGAAPVDSSIYMVMSWQNNKNDITAMCLKDKGYTISQEPPLHCQRNCDGLTEIVAGGGN